MTPPAFESVNGTQADSGTELTWTHTVAGDYLVVFVAGILYGTVPGGDGFVVWCDATPMGVIDVANQNLAVGTSPLIWAFGLANPPQGTVTIRVTPLQLGPYLGASVSLTGVDPRVQIGLTEGTTGFDTAPSITIPWGTDDLVLACLCQGVPAQSVTAVGGGQTERRRVTSPNTYVGISVTSAAQATHTWTLGSSIGWVVAALTLKPVGARGPTFLRARRIWERNARHFGKSNATNIATLYAEWDNGAGDTSMPAAFATTHAYYDGPEVHRRVAELLKLPDPHVTASAQCQDILVRGYYIANGGGVPGYQYFTRGLWLDYLRAGTPNSKTTTLLLRDNAAWSPAGDVSNHWRSRECAYALTAHIMAERLGYAPDGTRRQQLVEWAYGHLDQWFVLKNATINVPPEDMPPSADGKYTILPFMVGLTARALIEDWEETGDTRLIPALRRAADWLWTNAWDPVRQALWYENWTADVNANPIVWIVPTDGSPDLALLIAPLYAWLALQTGIRAYATQADLIFQGGVMSGYLGNGKQFDQSYTWSSDYITWRMAMEDPKVQRGACAGALA